MSAPRAGGLLVLVLAVGACVPQAAEPARPAGPASSRSGARAPAMTAPPATSAPRGLAAGPASFALSGAPTQGGWMLGQAPKGTVSLTFDGEPLRFADDGRFLVAFDRDAGPVATLVATLADGRRDTRAISVSPRDWRIEHVNIPRAPGGATEAFMALRRPELARIAAARAERTGAQGWRQHFVWPVRARISGRFGSQRIYRGGEAGAYHSGLDLAGGAGTAFVAPADGVVTLAAEKPFTLEGNLLMIDHGMGLNSAFLHCSAILVHEGEHVKQGQVIGRIGSTGRATGPHLHWSIKWGDARLDPLLFLDSTD